VQSLHLLFAPYCSTGYLIDANGSETELSLLRDTGAIRSWLSKSFATPSTVRFLNEKRLIVGIGGQVTEVDLVEITLESEFFTGEVLCGLIDTLPPGISFLIGNDLWFDVHRDKFSDEEITLAVVTMSKVQQNTAISRG
jgi:hypothetical protein